jgi:glycosyltransferase involved in cell wall biosynthesis
VNRSISVVTVTLNAARDFPRLVDSLRNQTDRDFDFVVIDGCSSDGTPEIIEACRDVVTYSISEPDQGFYDALNKAIRALRTEYYLVVGADDILYPNAIEDFRSATRGGTADIVVAGVKAGPVVRKGFRRNRAWLGHAAMVTSHSVGMLFRKKLHDTFGCYSQRYPLLADGHFIKHVCTSPSTRVEIGNFIAGEFGLSGVSNAGKNFVRVLCETWQVQLDTGESPIVQYLLFQLRLLRYLGRVLRRDATASEGDRPNYR